MNGARSEQFILDRVSKVHSAGKTPQCDYFISSNEIKKSGQFWVIFSERSDNRNLMTLLSHLRSRASAVRPAMDTAT